MSMIELTTVASVGIAATMSLSACRSFARVLRPMIRVHARPSIYLAGCRLVGLRVAIEYVGNLKRVTAICPQK